MYCINIKISSPAVLGIEKCNILKDKVKFRGQELKFPGFGLPDLRYYVVPRSSMEMSCLYTKLFGIMYTYYYLIKFIVHTEP